MVMVSRMCLGRHHLSLPLQRWVLARAARGGQEKGSRFVTGAASRDAVFILD